MSMPDYDWTKIYNGDPLLMPLRITFGLVALAVLVLLLGLH